MRILKTAGEVDDRRLATRRALPPAQCLSLRIDAVVNHRPTTEDVTVGPALDRSRLALNVDIEWMRFRRTVDGESPHENAIYIRLAWRDGHDPWTDNVEGGGPDRGR